MTNAKPLPQVLVDNLAALNAAVGTLNAIVHTANPAINPLWKALSEIKPADWDSPVRRAQDEANGDDPYL